MTDLALLVPSQAIEWVTTLSAAETLGIELRGTIC